MWRRMMLMPWRVRLEENDPHRVLNMDKPDWWVASGELPGILNWALAGLDRLRQQRCFTRSTVCEQALDEYRRESNPACMFLAETCRESPTEQVVVTDLYSAYAAWRLGNGFHLPLASNKFGAEVHRVFPRIERKTISRNGSRPYHYLGMEYQADGFTEETNR